MVAQLESSVVRIYSNKGIIIGAGFLVSQKHIVTCAHVVAPALGIKPDTSEIPRGEVYLDFPRISPREKLTARVVFWRPVNQLEFEEDIAGLELISPLPEDAKPVRLLTQEDFSGHSFEAFGFPDRQPNGVWSYGIIRAKTAKDWLQIEGNTQTGYRLEPGFSGTPVWDKKLAGVAGMAVAEDPHRKEAKVAFIIPSDLLIKAWPELKAQAIASCPYRGLSAFKPEDEPFFFGREDMTNNLVEAVQKKPLVAVIGASGSGKSSVVFAGLIPRLYQENTWLVAYFRPSDRTLPINSLTAAIILLLEPGMSNSDRLTKGNNIATELRKNLKLSDVVASILETKKNATRLLLVVDQFEELYTLCTNKQEQKQFLDVLLSAIATDSHQRTSNFTLVLTLRADFFENALSYSLFAEKLQQFSPEILRPMNRQELQNAITQPAEKQGVKIQDGLTQRILEDVGEEPGNLPLLEFALTQLWEKQTNNKLTHDAYDDIGGVKQALSKHADEVYSKLTEQEQQQTQKIFIQLVRPGMGIADTRRQATRAEIGEENWNLVKYLADERLVVSDGQKTIGEPKEETVEIVHEALIREWKLLQGWMERDRAFRLWQERLRGLILQWESKNQDEGALLRGALLAEAEGWQQKHPDELSKDEQYFIQKSIDLREKERDEREKRQQRELLLARSLAGVLGAIALVTTSIITRPLILRYQAASLNPLVSIPEGISIIGTNIAEAEKHEKPETRVRLPAFQIEQYEVSNKQYRLCVEARFCSEPAKEPLRFIDDKILDHPVVGVTAVQATKYCKWLGRRLPTELEWERAARGPEGRRWPWGKQDPTSHLANLSSGNLAKGTEPIDSHQDGASLEPEKVYNLVGNVWEWTASYVDGYPNSEQQVWDGQLKTLVSNKQLTLRGGSWKNTMERITIRLRAEGADTIESFGMRCAK